jgi:hypothetical protein
MLRKIVFTHDSIVMLEEDIGRFLEFNPIIISMTSYYNSVSKFHHTIIIYKLE